MENIFNRRILAFDVLDDRVNFGIAKYFFGKVKLYEVREYNNNFNFEVDDIIVVNLPWDYVLNLKLEVPLIKNKKELENFINIEISQNFNIDPSEFYFDYFHSFNNVISVFVVKKNEIEEYLNKLKSMNIPEPDIVYPDFLKESLLFQKYPGFNLFVFINKEYSGVLIFNNDQFVTIRYSDLSIKHLSEICEEEFGYTLYELEEIDDEVLIKDSKKFLYGFFGDLLSLIEREIYITLNSSNYEITLENLQTVTVFTDSKLLNELINEKYFESNILQNKFVNNNISYSLEKPRFLGCLGLLLRGGYEFGKVKFV